jgi:hypothetical protein
MATVARDSKGNYYVGPVDTPGAVLIYDAAGKVTGSIGRYGRGPGEHLMVSVVKIGAGDTLYVYDAGQWRLNVYSPARRLVRTVEMPRATLITDFLPQPSGDVIISAMILTAESIGFPFHVVSREGEIVRSFGEENPVVRPDGKRDMRVLAAAGPSKVWHARPTEYALDRFSLDGSPDLKMIRRASWFPPRARIPEARDPQVAKPLPTIRGLLQAADTLLWVRTDVAAPNWKQTWFGPPESSPAITSFEQYIGYYDTVLEAINPATGMLLASKQVDIPLQRFFGADMTFTHREDAEGYQYVDVWQFRLVAPRGVTK